MRTSRVMVMACGPAVLTLVGTSLTHQGSSAVIADDIACSTCKLRIVRSVILGDKEGPNAISDQVNAVRIDGLGRYWIMAGDTPPYVFDASGRLVTRVGRSGAGPGETIRPLDAVSLPGDSVLVFDGELSRLTVFDKDLKAARSVQLGTAMRPWLVLQWPSIVIANAQLGSPESVGWPLHLGAVSSRGFDLRKSFGPGEGEFRPIDYARTGQVLAPSNQANTFWSSDETLYRVSLWTQDGERALEFSRRPVWFATQSGNTLGTPNRPPQPRVSCIAEDKEGYLWVAVRMPKATWREGWPAISAAEYSLSAMAFEKMFRTNLEVLNPRARKVVARFELEDWILDCLPDRRFAINQTEFDGTSRVKVAWFSLDR